jgi:hypothetical protein
MEEIKSTLELAMERTQRLSISDEEKIGIKQKEKMRKAGGLFNRYVEGHLTVNEILKELERMEEKTAKTIKETLFSQLVDALSLSGEDERLLKGVESLKPQRPGFEKIRQKLFHLLSQYQREKEKVEEEAKIQAIEAFRTEGIYGSAVEPNMEGGKFLKNKLEDLAARSGARLKEIKEQLKTL